MASKKSQVAALEETIRVLGDLGRLDEIDAARVAIARGLAAACDEAPGNAALWREFRAAEAALREIREVDDAELGELESFMRAAVGDAEESAS